MGRWQDVRMAADYVDGYEIAELSTRATALVIGGVEIGASFGGNDEFVEDPIWGFPPAYFKQFASASPTVRAGYDPACDLPSTIEPEYKDAYLGASIESIMRRTNKANHVVSRNGDSIPTGGSGGNGGGKAKRAIGASEEAAQRALDRDVGPIEQSHLGDRFTVYGLTRTSRARSGEFACDATVRRRSGRAQ